MWMLRAVSYILCKTVWFIKYHGRENIPDRGKGSFLIAANHQTYFDAVWICLPIFNPLRFMAWDEAFAWRFIGPLIAYMGAFPVSMEVGSTLKAMKEAMRVLRGGGVLTVFPEGERERADGRLRPFKPGVIRIALQAGVPILPVTINGGNRIWPQDQKYPRFFRRVEVTYHPLMVISEDESLEPHENLERWAAKLQAVIASGLHGQDEQLPDAAPPEINSGEY
jgi:1-acyl-sn-glycerol-3-phosphate acyltransferase